MTSVATAAALLDGLFAAIDDQDLDRFLGFMTEEAVFRFGSAPAVQGKDAIRAAVSGFYSTIAALRHVVPRIVVKGNVVICEGETTYTRHDGTQITLPFANVFELEGELISTYKIYADIGPLYDT